MTDSHFDNAVSQHIWESKYRYRPTGHQGERNIVDSWQRVATALAEVEAQDQARWRQRFLALLEAFRFIPGGRILAGAGTAHQVTLFNCFVMGLIDDSMEGIFSALREGALTLQQGGGVGYDFSTLRPRGSLARTVGTVASGPVSFMGIWDSMCATLLSTGARRGAMMATLRCDHPDIGRFIHAKQDGRVLQHFNLSVQVSDDFMAAVREDRQWPLVFPVLQGESPVFRAQETVLRHWPGQDGPVPCRIYDRVPARALWEDMMRANYNYAEPGVLFIDRINHFNNLYYREHLSATNPCGEIPLPPYGACDLGSINLTRFIDHPLTERAVFRWQALDEVVPLAVRLLDNVIELSRFPLAAQARQARGTRRIGLGITGLADALIMLGLKYDSDDAREFAARVMRHLCHGAYRASVSLAREKGAFPWLDKARYLQAPFIKDLPEDIRDGIERFGIRNSHLIAIAPTGTISLLANNISSGLEPVFDFSYRRRVQEEDGTCREHEVEDYAWHLWHAEHPGSVLPAAFINARELSPKAHIQMQAAVQPYVDNAISKTINIPEDFAFEAFQDIYRYAYDQGLKGCTTFRPNPVTGEVLVTGPFCCTSAQ